MAENICINNIFYFRKLVHGLHKQQASTIKRNIWRKDLNETYSKKDAQ